MISHELCFKQHRSRTLHSTFSTRSFLELLCQEEQSSCVSRSPFVKSERRKPCLSEVFF